MRRLFSLLIVLFFSQVYGKTLVTTKPLFYVVAPLLKGIEEPLLLRDTQMCSHHRHLRPSHIEKLRQADVVLCEVGESSRLSPLLKKDAVVRAPFFEKKAGELLSPRRVRAKINELTLTLKAYYPVAQHAQIEENAREFILKLDALDAWVKEQLKALKVRALVTTYPFLTCFAEDYDLSILRILMNSPLESAKPRSIKEIRALLTEGKILGVLKDHHIPEDILKRMFSAYEDPILEVDIEALQLPMTLDGYEILIENMVQSIVRWAK